jgi:hypothetical protein
VQELIARSSTTRDLHQRIEHRAQVTVGIGELARLLEVVRREDFGAARQPAHALQRGGEDLRLAAELRAVADRPGHGDRDSDAAEMAHGAGGIEFLGVIFTYLLRAESSGACRSYMPLISSAPLTAVSPSSTQLARCAPEEWPAR